MSQGKQDAGVDICVMCMYVWAFYFEWIENEKKRWKNCVFLTKWDCYECYVNIRN